MFHAATRVHPECVYGAIRCRNNCIGCVSGVYRVIIVYFFGCCSGVRKYQSGNHQIFFGYISGNYRVFFGYVSPYFYIFSLWKTVCNEVPPYFAVHMPSGVYRVCYMECLYVLEALAGGGVPPAEGRKAGWNLFLEFNFPTF